MPTRSGKNFKIAQEPITSAQHPTTGSRHGQPPSNAPLPQSASDKRGKRVREGKQRIRDILAHMQRNVFDFTEGDNLDQDHYHERSQDTTVRGRSGKARSTTSVSSKLAAESTSEEDEPKLHANTTANSVEPRTSPQAKKRDIHAVDQVGADGRAKEKAKIEFPKERRTPSKEICRERKKEEGMEQKKEQKKEEKKEQKKDEEKKEQKKQLKREQKKQRREERQAQAATNTPVASTMFSLAEAKQFLACDSHFTPTYDLQTGKHIAWPVVRSYHLGAMGRYVDGAAG